MPCYGVSSHVIVYYVMSCHVMSWCIIFSAKDLSGRVQVGAASILAGGVYLLVRGVLVPRIQRQLRARQRAPGAGAGFGRRDLEVRHMYTAVDWIGLARCDLKRGGYNDDA